MNEQLDILAFGAHAYDVEIGMGGTIAKYTSCGKKVGICDLTRAELSSNGTVEGRLAEAKRAAERLGVKVRENLNLSDRGLFLSEQSIQEVVALIRKYRPKLVCTPYHLDRHPDHGNCTKIVEEAFFSAGIRKLKTAHQYAPYRPNKLIYYMINGFHKPDFVIDISDFMELKLASLTAYESQFQRGPETVETPLVNDYLESVEARERLFGKEVGVKYAEGFITKTPILLNRDLLGEHE
ncbi:bacillithiol biosynthesis deacetylase BshB1 [Bacillus sp. 7504-2]|nr:bacillithiol biosynthesis deacetylase BshB1 [Bacillus sp. 7504-2]